MDARGVVEKHAGERDLFRPDGTATGQTQSVGQSSHQESHRSATNDSISMSWTAAEFAANPKTPWWYLGMGMVAVMVVCVVWFVTKDMFDVVAISIGGIVLGVYASHKPREQSYSLTDSVLTIGKRHYPLTKFRAFSAEAEGGLIGIELMPLERFMAYVTIYADSAKGEQVVKFLSLRLPKVMRQTDLTESLMRRIRF